MGNSPRKPAAQTCTHHCSSCGRHFHSLKAFDGHRQGDYADKRFCEAPEAIENKHGQRTLQVWAESGICRLTAEDQIGVTIWQTVPSADLNTVFGRAAA